MQERQSNNNEPLSLENAKKGHELIKRTTLDTSPLEIVVVEDKGAAVVLGRQRITEWFPTEQECHDFTNTWDFVVRLIGGILESWDKFKEEDKKQEPTGPIHGSVKVDLNN